MNQKFQIYTKEDKTTYFLEIDHEKKTFALGSAKGKAKAPSFVPIDISGYKEHIRKIEIEYKFAENNIIPH